MRKMEGNEGNAKTKRTMNLVIRAVMISVTLACAALAFLAFTDGLGFIGSDSSRVAAFNAEVEKSAQIYYDVQYSPGISYGELKTFDRKFEQYPSGAASLNEEFEEFWGTHGGNLLKQNLMGLPYTRDGLGDRTAPHVGGLISKEYTFRNVSSIPVYLRVSAPQVRGGINASAHFISVQDGHDSLIFGDAGDGYVYWRNVIEPDEAVNIEVIAYVPHRGNEGIGNPVNADIFVEYAEILQATNNAIHYAEGWREVAEKGVFELQSPDR